MLNPYITYMHIKDADENGIVVPPGQGIGNIGELLKRYYAKGGRNLTLEPHLKALSVPTSVRPSTMDLRSSGKCTGIPQIWSMA